MVQTTIVKKCKYHGSEYPINIRLGFYRQKGYVDCFDTKPYKC